jgi:hypothetical protein
LYRYDEKLFKLWNEEMQMMAGRIKTVRGGGLCTRCIQL